MEFARTALDRMLVVRGLPRSPAELKGEARRGTRSGVSRIRRLLPRVLALIDVRAAAAEVTGVAAACNQPQGPQSTSTIGGSSVSLSSEGAEMSFEGGGVRVLVSMALGGACDRFEGPQCPTAEGVLKGTDRSRFVVTLTVFQGNQLVSRTVTSREGRLLLEGRSADDARFDTLQIKDRVDETLQSGPVNLSAVVTRNATIDMRTGLWLPENAQVSVNYVTVGGQFLSDAEANAALRRLGTDYDRDFPQIVSREIGVYRGREQNMQSPGQCATLELVPASNSLAPLELGAGGQLTATAEAKEGGGNSPGRFTVFDQQNGIFLPSESRGLAGAFFWTVTEAGRDVKLFARVKATSKAGTTQQLDWSQPTKPPRPPVRRIAGTVRGTATQAGGAVLNWTASVGFLRQPPLTPGAPGSYQLESGTSSWQVSGTYKVNADTCSVSGSKTIPIAFGGVEVSGESPSTYAVSAYVSDVAIASTLSACGESQNEGDAVTVVIAGGAALQSGQHVTPDGLTYNDSYAQSGSGNSFSNSWTLTGTIEPDSPG